MLGGAETYRNVRLCCAFLLLALKSPEDKITFFPYVTLSNVLIRNPHTTQLASLLFESILESAEGKTRQLHSFYSRQIVLDRNFH